MMTPRMIWRMTNKMTQMSVGGHKKVRGCHVHSHHEDSARTSFGNEQILDVCVRVHLESSLLHCLWPGHLPMSFLLVGHHRCYPSALFEGSDASEQLPQTIVTKQPES